MRFVFSFAVTVAAMSLVGAAPGAAPLSGVCADQTLEDRRVEPLQLISWLLSRGPVSDLALDADADGNTLIDEKRRALTDPDFCADGHCTDADRAAINDAQALLAKLARGDDDRVSVRHRISGDPGTAVPIVPTPEELLATGNRTFELVCRSPEPSRLAEAMPESAPAPGVAPGAGPEEIIDGIPDDRFVFDRGAGGFRLTGGIDDLNKDRERLKDVRPAEFSINNNINDNVTTYQVNAVAGYDFEFLRGEELRLSVIPFGLFHRFFNGTRNNIDQIGLGGQFALELDRTRIGSGEVALSPLLTSDTSLETAIGSLKFRYTPALRRERSVVPLGRYDDYDPFRISLGLDLLTDAGRVFDAGDNEGLTDRDTFLRPGGRLTIRIRGQEDTLLERIEFDVTDRYLYNVGDPIRHLNLLGVGVSYIFPNVDNYKVSFTYQTGRNDETLDRVSFWRSQFGIRF